MPMPARTLKTFLRFMLEALHTRDQSPCDLPGHRSVFMNRNDRLISQRFENTPVGRVFTRLLGDGARGADTPVGDASISERDATARPRPGARVAGVANGTAVQVVQAGERQATRWAHLYLRYRVRSGNMSRGFCYRARRRPPWILSPLTRNSLAGAARSWPHQSPIHTLLCQTGLCALLMFYCFGGFRLGLGLVHRPRSEEHTSELQSRQYLVCSLLLEKKKATNQVRLMQIFTSLLVLVLESL